MGVKPSEGTGEASGWKRVEGHVARIVKAVDGDTGAKNAVILLNVKK